jgi:adenylosuccinate lyase
LIPRYTTFEMSDIWSDESRLSRWRDVELAVLEARVGAGLTSAALLKDARDAPMPTPRDVEILEETVRHDVVAFLSCWTARMDPLAATHVHRDLTSSDVVDTALGLALQAAARLIRGAGQDLLVGLCDLALDLRDVLCVGRTHGQAAAFDVMGHRFADFAFALDRSLTRFASSSVQVGLVKLSGPIGTGARLGPALVANVADSLGLAVPDVTTQIVFRDGIAAWVADIALLGAVCEAIATDVRIGQHDGVQELHELRVSGQEGSSAMPHKRNPIMAENITGLARLLRSYVGPALEDVALWQHRDLSHSSVERVILADAAAIAETILRRTGEMVAGLEIDTENVRANIDRAGALLASSLIRSHLLRDGSPHQDVAHTVRQRLAEDAVSAAEIEAAAAEVLASRELDRVFGNVIALRSRYTGADRP